jgi:class 3 adenylate cyclase
MPRLESSHPKPRDVFQRCRWPAEGQRNILFHEGLPLLGAEDRRMDVVAWLRGLGLERYAPAFRDNDVDGEVLPELTSDDLTVMFCDLVGSTALSARVDPEDFREIIGTYHRAVAEIVVGFDGFVAKYMGRRCVGLFRRPGSA